MEPELRKRGLSALFLFGSSARDQARAESDIDVFAEFAPGSRVGWDFAGIPEALASQLGRRIDFTTRGALHPLLKADIEREAIRIF
ncbi:MAG: nucleotidyltransferase domain-containing protein [Alphaproteobacteria bacterium]|nr:nucleotidyltransferase domain-containing protein [Alphaproteobacteria bacterium]MBU2378707.1 nucleotidyltransferase domain-containing protein [Alphaproteobacteria bacterium]